MDRVAIVTGANSGMGMATSLALARTGAQVVMLCRSKSRGEAALAQVRELSGSKSVELLLCDLGSMASIRTFYEEFRQKFSNLHILVNNAGIGQEFAPTIEQSIERWDKITDTHLRGTYLCSRRAGQWMVNRKSGNIINIASIVGCGGFPMRTAYGPAKAGIINMTEVLAVEWAPYNIRVNCIAPGVHPSELGHDHPDMRRSPGSQKTPAMEERIKRTIEDIPMRREGGVDELAGLAVLLASEASSYITGQVFVQDGGRSIKH